MGNQVTVNSNIYFEYGAKKVMGLIQIGYNSGRGIVSGSFDVDGFPRDQQPRIHQ